MKRFIALLLFGQVLFLSSALTLAQTSGSAAFAQNSDSAAEGHDADVLQETFVSPAPPATLTAALANDSDYRISLLTCGPGSELYSTFGHSALRVRNMMTGTDDVYNFGMFDFSDPDFYMKFLKGSLDYYLGVQDFDNFLLEYQAENRYVYEQTLDLTAIQTERVLSELDYRNLPENRAYKYEFIQRNCTTELRDIISEAVEQNDLLWAEDSGTWRRYLNACLTENAWAKIGINIILGSRVDVRITNFEKMCLPELLSEGLDRIKAGDGLESESEMIAPSEAGDGKGFFGKNYPYILLIIIALAVVLINSRALDFIYCLVLGVVGLLIIFLMFYGTHMEFKMNYNLLLFNPLLIWLGIAALRRGLKSRNRGESYAPNAQSFYGRGNRSGNRCVKIPAALSSISMLCLIVVWILGIQGFETGILIMAVPALWIDIKYLMVR